ncbi:MAG: polymer-forming cytoskeletal protein [Proteobacteria bacterium]|nr:polymer-forming cytoskeletal protein [Pseudomonadota bacterium]
MFGKETKTESGITLVATNCELEGDVHFSDQLIVNGIVKGNIYAQAGSKATVTISEKGRVKGEIHVPNVIVNGKIFGDIRSDRHIELAAKAEVKGNVYYHLIEMVKGSRVDGHLVHMQDGKGEVAEPQPARNREKPEEADAQAAPMTSVKSRSA